MDSETSKLKVGLPVSKSKKRTLEELSSLPWTGCQGFPVPALEQMTEFLSLHPSLESPGKEPPRKKLRTDNMVEMDEEAQMVAAIYLKQTL